MGIEVFCGVSVLSLFGFFSVFISRFVIGPRALPFPLRLATDITMTFKDTRVSQ